MAADTTWYGQFEMIDGRAHALPFDNKNEGSWTFDRGTGPFNSPSPLIENGEGWSAFISESPTHIPFRVIDGSLDLGEGVDPPLLEGDQSLWIGADRSEAEGLCWPCSAGYGDDWCQRVASEPLLYEGAGDVAISFLYFSDAEDCFDGTQVYLSRADQSELMLNPYPIGTCSNNTNYRGGTITGTIGSSTIPEVYTRLVTTEEIGEPQEIRFLFEFKSDGNTSDEDCGYETDYGPVAIDSISISGGGIDAVYDFEAGMQGWTTSGCPNFVDIVDVDCYEILDPCDCNLTENVLEMHVGPCEDANHPWLADYRHIESPICNLGGSEPKSIFMEFEMYSVHFGYRWFYYRPGWRYFPHICELTGEEIWSERVGRNSYIYSGDNPRCRRYRHGGTEIEAEGVPVPPHAEKVIATIEIYFDSWDFGVPGFQRSSDFAPVFDNLTVGVNDGVLAPVVNLVNGGFQDVGSSPNDLFDPRAPGPANTGLNVASGEPGAAFVAGDSLVVIGPDPEPGNPEARWEARLWWRVARRAPFQADMEDGADSRYRVWRDRVADGLQIDRPHHPEFTWGWMDSVQTGYYPPPSRSKFCSYFREDDDDFRGENFDGSNPETEMIWDDVLYPGSRIEYFLTSNYIGTPLELHFLPDTTGGYFYEFEILPGLRTVNIPDCGGPGFDYCVYQPAILYIDLFNRGAQVYIENSLRTILNGLPPCTDPFGCEIPSNRNWDRYDINPIPGGAHVPFARGLIAGSDNGMTLNQVLGYRTILVNSADLTVNTALHDEDYMLFDSWLTSPDCEANLHRQALLLNGDGVGDVDPSENPYGAQFVTQTLGATLVCDAFNGSTEDLDCGEENTSYCVRLLPTDGSFPSEIDVDAWGSWCPNLLGYHAYSPANGGVGNRLYHAEDGTKEMSFAQITNEDLSPSGNYRTVLDGASWHHMTEREPGGVDEGLCPRDLPSIVSAGIAEIGAALKWCFDVEDVTSIPVFTNAKELMECQGTGDIPTDTQDLSSIARVNRLYQNQPNPFNPVTTIRFNLARDGPVEIRIYDVSGKSVKTLVDQTMEAGTHTVAWNGTNDDGNPLGSGVYWSQMTAGSYVSNKKMVVLK